MPNIKLKSMDGVIVSVDVEIARRSLTIKTMLQELGIKEEDEEEVIPLLNVNSAILEMVIAWATHHHKADRPHVEDDKQEEKDTDDKQEEKGTDDISDWDAKFLKVDLVTLIQLILAANYLDIKELIEVGCQTVSNMIKGKTPTEIRETLDIKQDLTPAEEEQIRQENEWCEKE